VGRLGGDGSGGPLCAGDFVEAQGADGEDEGVDGGGEVGEGHRPRQEPHGADQEPRPARRRNLTRNVQLPHALKNTLVSGILCAVNSKG